MKGIENLYLIMQTKIKPMKLIKYMIIIALYLSTGPVIFSQTTSDKSDAQRDWEHLDYMKNFFCKAPEGCREYDNLSMLEAMRYIDRLYTTRSKLAEAFLEKYPNDPHHDQALVLFFSSYFTPKFIPDSLAPEKIEAIASLAIRGQSGAWSKAYRLIPVDREAEKRWLDKGKDYVDQILASNASVEVKAKAEILLFNRDYSLAKNKYTCLSKDPMEQDFWASMEANYFEFVPLRLERLMDAYPDSETVATFIQAMLDDLRKLSSGLANSYLDRFLRKSGDTNPMANRKGITALRKSLLANIEALGALEVDADKPLEFTFTAMDGSQVDLAEMRGKVVLINFWSTTCPSGIAVMPRLKTLYDKYRDHGFEIIGIADDGDVAKDQVLKILEKANANWPQRLDKGREASVKLHALYGIKTLPTFWLLDTKGVVVDQGVKMPQLESKIIKYLE
ncbi:MAG: hypothetical protein B7Z06_00235 [Flavobacteriales bacterium 32-35-8]|nr:MAG: hypothetical protein B7Z06_00235 [Flavobacteriales bacterium 32-35-8]